MGLEDESFPTVIAITRKETTAVLEPDASGRGDVS